MSRTPDKILQEEFLVARAKILELAAILDRIDRAGPGAGGPNLETEAARRQLSLLQQGLDILNGDEPERARRVQQLMSRPYDPQWRTEWTI